MDFKVKKGLEQPLLIQGMISRYFYYWLIVCGTIFTIIVYLLMQATKPGGSAGAFVIALVLGAGVAFGLKIFFVLQSNKKRMRFGSKKSVISNIDIMKALK